MNPFSFSRAGDVETALKAHAQYPGTAFVAGGTDLLGLVKDGAAKPARLLDISRLPGLDAVTELPDGTLRLGSLVRMSDAAGHARVRQDFPVVAESLLLSASGQLRNMATLGGNIMQRTRCAYFRDPDEARCNKRMPGSGCAASDGLNRNHAILGWSPACVATNPSDLSVALSAMDAVVRVRSSSGERAVPFGEFHRLAGTSPERDNVIAPGDLIVAIDLPRRAEARSSHYLKVRDRQSYEFAIVSVAAGVHVSDGRLGSVRLAMGGVAHKPWRLPEAERALVGLRLDDEAGLKTAIASSFVGARSLRENGFKVELARRAVLRAVQTAGERA